MVLGGIALTFLVFEGFCVLFFLGIFGVIGTSEDN
jgi:hypothetical protein